jgi:uncharacterized membrane protein
MRLSKILLGLVLVAVALFVVSAVVSAVFAAISFIWWVFRTTVALAIIGAILYGGYRVYSWFSDDSASTATSTDVSPDNRVDELRQRYASGEISEAELERRLERELADDGVDSIDRELERERR